MGTLCFRLVEVPVLTLSDRLLISALTLEIFFSEKSNKLIQQVIITAYNKNLNGLLLILAPIIVFLLKMIIVVSFRHGYVLASLKRKTPHEVNIIYLHNTSLQLYFIPRVPKNHIEAISLAI